MIEEVMLGEQFAVLIANDDLTGLSDAECANFVDLCDKLDNPYMVVADDAPVWTRCKATGLDGDCITVTIHRK
jgi:hypothetical protein